MKDISSSSNATIEKIHAISSSIKLCTQLCIVLGVLVAIVYCGTIGYYPSGLTTGDSLFFVAASLGFAGTYSLAVVAFLCAGIAFSPLLRSIQSVALLLINWTAKVSKKRAIKSKICFPRQSWSNFTELIFGLLVIAIIALGLRQGVEGAVSLAMTVPVMGFLWGLWNTKPRRREYNLDKERRIKLLLAVLIYLTPSIVVEVKGSFLNQSMRMIGVRAEDRIILLDKKNTDFLRKHNVDPLCSTDLGEGIYHDVLIKFRGIGENTVLDIDGFTISVSSSVIVIGSGKMSTNDASESVCRKESGVKAVAD